MAKQPVLYDETQEKKYEIHVAYVRERSPGPPKPPKNIRQLPRHGIHFWDQRKIRVGVATLDEALTFRTPGPYQIQAAISALHAEAPTADVTDWRQIAALYDSLAAMVPSVAVEVNRAVAVAMAWGAQTGLTMLLQLEHLADAYYPYHAARADLLRRTGQREAAADAYQRACDLCSNNAERTYLQQQLDEMKKNR